jgi:hypothetical protein
MSHLYLPTDHSEIDRALASAVAEAVESAELFVAWTLEGGAARAPEAAPALRRPDYALARPLTGLRALWGRLRHRRREPAGYPVAAARGSRLEGADLQP